MTEDGQAPVKINLSHNHTGIRIDTGVCCIPTLWTGNGKRPIMERTKFAKADNDRIEEIVREYDTAIYELTKSGRIKTMRPADIRAYVHNKGEEYKSTVDFFALAAAIRSEKREVTAGHIDDMLRWVHSFVGRRKTLAFEDITLKWLNDLKQFMSTHSEQSFKSGLSSSTQGIILRNIKMVYNRAIVDGQARQEDYPFKGFKMPKATRRKEFLMPDELRRIRDIELDPASRMFIARDYFLLSFYTCGTNLADIYDMEPDRDGYISYRRNKTEHKVDDKIRMKLHPLAAEIVARRRGTGMLVDAREHYASYESFYSGVRHGLDALAELLGIGKITSYMARYTWATYAGHENVPEYVIDRSLGHAETTVAGRHYISYDWRKTDKANRIVIEYASSDRPWDEDVDW